MYRYKAENEKQNDDRDISSGIEWPNDVANNLLLNQLQQFEQQLSAIESTAKVVQGELHASNQVIKKYKFDVVTSWKFVL